MVVLACSKEEDKTLFDEQKAAFVADWKEDKNLQHYYCRQGALFVEDQIYKNRTAINAYFKEQKQVDTFKTIALIQHDSTNYFDVGYYYLTDSLHRQLAYVIAWKKEKGQWLKELEVLYPVHLSKKIAEDTITKKREQWEYLSNEHQPEALAEVLYGENGFYLNDGYIYEGMAPIAQKYAYMKKENWRIRLATIHTAQVTDSLFYDVGQYLSSGRGHYFMLWKRQKEGDWKVLLDFNF